MKEGLLVLTGKSEIALFIALCSLSLPATYLGSVYVGVNVYNAE